jgi:hypothetical protein
MKRMLIEILPRTRNEVDQLLGGARPKLLVTEHYFPDASNHRLIACGADIEGVGQEAAFAALRLMRFQPEVRTERFSCAAYVVPAYQWGG